MSLAGDEQILEMSSANIVLLFEWRKRNVIFFILRGGTSLRFSGWRLPDSSLRGVAVAIFN